MKILMFGEIKVGTGVIHQPDFAKAVGAERLITLPKDTSDVRVVVGKLLKDRKPALLIAAEKKGLPKVAVDELLTPEVITKLADVLSRKIKRAGYESRALEALTALIVPSESKPDTGLLAQMFPMPKTRGGKNKAVKNG